MRSLLVVDDPERWISLAQLLSGAGEVTLATRELSRAAALPRPRGLSIVGAPTSRAERAATLDRCDAIVHAGPSSRLDAIVDELGTAGERPRVVVAVAGHGKEGTAIALSAERAARPGLRVCCARVAAWIGERRGLVRALAPLYRCFVGLREAPGDRAIPWCHAYDIARALEFAIQSTELAGSFDVVTPEPASVAALDRAIAGALGQTPLLRMSISTATRLLGERLAQELPAVAGWTSESLVRGGFTFVFPDLRSAVIDVLRDDGSERPSRL